MTRRFAACLVLTCLCCLAGDATKLLAQGLLVDVSSERRIRLPRPIPQPEPNPDRYKIEELQIRANLVDQVARVQVSQTFVNTGSRQMEVCFVFPLPYDGAIDRLTLLVDGKEYPAELLPADKAREMYESIVRKNKDPALLEWVGTGMFKTSVFPVPPGARRAVTLRYTQICRMTQGLTDFLFPLSTAKYTSDAVEKVDIRVSIESEHDIKNVYSPTHSVDIKRPDDRHAIVHYERKNDIPSSDFRLFYDVGKEKVGARVISYRPDDDEEGYFLLLATPEIDTDEDEHPRKTVVFVVDRSGSMSGEKIEQAKGALKFVLNNLREGDLFNVVAYDSEVESFRPELQRYDDETRQAALGFVEGLYAGGSTNIDGALTSALTQLQDDDRPNYVIFLTDGLPTTGERNETKIVANAREHNDVRARVFAFGVGYDVNSRLLDKLVRENFGQSDYVRPDEDIEASVSRLYNRIGAPVMTDVEIAFDLEGVRPEDGTPVNRVYPSDLHDLFAGEQLVMVGRYRKSGDAKVKISGRVGDRREKFDFPAELVEESRDETNGFVQRLWAVRRVGEIIDELDLKGQNEELVNELVRLATKNGILTPYTSFIADENRDRDDLARLGREAGERTELLLQLSEGQSAFEQRRAKALYRQSDLPSLEAAPAGADAFGGFGGRARTFFYDAVEGKPVAVNTVRTVGSKTFFVKDGRWIDSAVSSEQSQAAKPVERYSREYFDLVSRHGKEVAKYLAIDDPVVIKLGDTVYTW
ncbi:MAG: VIT domain-containing protein [Pirellulales bacterium]